MEGPDGAGKSTQLRAIRDFFVWNGENALFTREPGGTPISEKIRRIILDNENTDMAPMTEALLYAASRAQHVSQVIKPALEHGKTVICDRFVDSSIVYQGYGRRLGDSVAVINEYAIDGCMPDITFLMKLPPSVSRNRINTEDMDRLESESERFYEDVYRGYIFLEKKYPDRIISIDADRDINDISSDIIKHLENILKEREYDFQRNK